MSYRTILVHLNDSRRARKLLRHAAEIARTFEARLVGLHVSPTFHGRVVDPDYPHIPALEGLKFSSDEEADHLRAIFDEVTDSERFCGAFRSNHGGAFCTGADCIGARPSRGPRYREPSGLRMVAFEAVGLLGPTGRRKRSSCPHHPMPMTGPPCRRRQLLPGTRLAKQLEPCSKRYRCSKGHARLNS